MLWNSNGPIPETSGSMIAAIRGSSRRFPLEAAISAVRSNVSCSGGRATSVPVRSRRTNAGGCSIVGSGPKPFDGTYVRRRSTQMTSPSGSAHITSAGRLFSSPPSTRSCSPRCTGGRRPGVGIRSRPATPKSPPPMDDRIAGDQVRRNGEKTSWQMLDQGGAAEEPFYQTIDAPTSCEGYRRDRVVANWPGFFHVLACRGGRIGGVQPQREGRSGESTGARSAKSVDDDARPGELFVDAVMREPSSAP